MRPLDTGATLEAVPVAYLCPSCGRRVERRGRCANCPPTDSELRRRARHREHGYSTTRHRTLRAIAIAEAGACEACGSTSDLTADHLRYPAVTIDDYRVLCRSCNGRDGATRTGTRRTHSEHPQGGYSGGELLRENVGSSRVDLQACKLEYSIVSPK